MTHAPKRPCSRAGCSRLTTGRLCDVHALPEMTLETARVILVCGPPGAGKSTFVRERMMPGDLIVDVDALASALTGEPFYRDSAEALPYALAARDAVVNGLERNRDRLTQRAWVITGGARRDRRDELRDRLHAHIVVLEVPAEECLRRIADDARRGAFAEQWRPRIAAWWRDYRSSDEDDQVRIAA